jgi:5-methylcytosine-specific restriction endonuclease McrA
MRTDILARRREIEKWIQQHQSKAFICQQLECRPATLESWLERLGIKYKGQQSRPGKTSPFRKHATEFLKDNKFISSTHRLKLLLLRDGLKHYQCERCKRSKWLGQPIPLELHHRDGNRLNNKFENLQLLCANCHALTPNNSGRGIKQR